jgi:TonB-linked SusC/RagA family outer membrane protein
MKKILLKCGFTMSQHGQTTFTGSKIFLLLLMLLSVQVPSSVFSQSVKKTITGIIKNDNGNPLQGVTIMVKGSSSGASSDASGKFSLEVPDNAILEVSFIGFQSQEVSVKGQSQINIVLVNAASAMDDVVVVGYGTQKKINLTGAVGVVDAKDIENRPITNVLQALQGQVAGLMINQTGGQPGSESFNTKIRGVSTFSGNDPLVIVDGIATSLNSLNPNDIESVSVLKDAASAAIYGARASGGVILVTTKKGKAGKMKISYDGYAGIQTPTSLPKMVNAYDHVLLWREAEHNDNPNTTVYKYSLDQLEKYRTGELPSEDRLGYLFDHAPQTEHNISMSGGNDKNRYFISLGYLYQDGTMKNTSYSRYNMRVNNTFKVTNNFDINVNAQFAPAETTAPSAASYPSGPTRTVSDIIYDAYRRGSDDVTFTKDGRWAAITGWANRFGLASKDGGFETNKFNRFSGVLTLNYKISSDFSLNGTYGTSLDFGRQVDYSKKMQFIDPIDLSKVDFDYNTNSLLISHNNADQHNAQLLLNYNKTFNGLHEVKGLLGYSQEWNNSLSEAVGRRNFITDDIYVINGGNSDPSTWTTTGSASAWALRSYFGRLNYAFNEKYLFEGILRYDGSSRFSSDKRWGLFPSFSAGWRINEESFMKNVKSITNLKLRGSWGQVGNQNVALYQYYSTIANSAYYFNGSAQTATYYSGSPNVNLTWESKTTTNIGLDLGFIQNRLNFSVDVFQDRTAGILMQPAVPSSYGLSAPYQNVATVNNKGWEFEASYRNKYKPGGFTYKATFQISDAKNKVISMIGSPQISGNKITEVGHEMNEWYGYKSLGIFGTQAEVDNYAHLNPKTGIGDLKIEDINNDGKITAADRQRLGSSYPRYPYGFHLELGWKNFFLSGFVQGVAYRKIFIGNVNLPINGGLETAQEQYLDRWHSDDAGKWIPGKFPKMRIGSFNNTFSSFWLQNAAYLRLKNIQIGYSLPRSILNKLKIEKATFYVSGENLFTITGIYGFDPEAPESVSFYPLSKITNFGLNITL